MGELVAFYFCKFSYILSPRYVLCMSVAEDKGKIVPVLNQVPCHEDVFCTKLSTTPRHEDGWGVKLVVSFTPRPLYPQGKSPPVPIG